MQAVAGNGRTSTIEAWLNRRRACARVMHNKLSISCSLSLGDATTAANSGDESGVYESCWLPSGSEIGLVSDALLNLSHFYVRKTFFSGANSGVFRKRMIICLCLRRESG